MEIPNAFIGKKSKPSAADLIKALGPAAAAWKELLGCLADGGISSDNWQSISPKYGWSLRPALKARTILYMSPCEGCFRASFALGDKAVAAARKSGLPKELLAEIVAARRYAEGTPVRVIVRGPEDLETVKKLVAIKLQN